MVRPAGVAASYESRLVLTVEYVLQPAVAIASTIKDSRVKRKNVMAASESS
jgi:hypothetical protein